MPSFCAVVGCSSRFPRDQVSFFRFPAIYIGSGRRGRSEDSLSPIAIERRRRWILALRRENVTETMLRNQRVCSKHFITGKPSHLNDVDHPDWVPTVNMGYERQSGNIQRYDRAKKRRLSPVRIPILVFSIFYSHEG